MVSVGLNLHILFGAYMPPTLNTCPNAQFFTNKDDDCKVNVSSLHKETFQRKQYKEIDYICHYKHVNKGTVMCIQQSLV